MVRDGRSGLLVDGHDPRDWAAALTRVLDDGDLRVRLEAGALEQARLFSWDATADRTLEVYERAAADARASRYDATPRQVVRAYLADNEIEYDESRRGVCSASRCPARRSSRPRSGSTSAPHALGVHAFVCRKPDENHERVYGWLLQRNLRIYAVAFAVDRLGDIYLDARLPLAVVDPDELDRLLGAVLTAADESFNTILELGFASSIRKEWEWRRERGEPTHNLEAFRGWLEAEEPTSAAGEDQRRRRRAAGSACTTRIRRLTVAAP